MLSAQQALMRCLGPVLEQAGTLGSREAVQHKTLGNREIGTQIDMMSGYICESVVSRPWASATFEGHVHEIRLTPLLPAGPERVDVPALLDRLAAVDLSRYGHVLIDLSLRAVADRWCRPGGAPVPALLLEALTIVD